MDPALLPRTAPGRQLSWLMNLRVEPSVEEIQEHLEPTAAVEIQVDLRERRTRVSNLASGLLALGTMARELPGTVSRSEDALLRLELAQGARVLHALVTVDEGGKVGLLGLREPPAEDEVESDRVRLLYDRAATAYEQLGGEQAHYWVRARAWLQEKTRDGCTLLDVGCGPGHHVADLLPSVRVLGCDLSPEMVQLAALARPGGTFVVHDYHEPFPAQWPLADLTVALGCLEFCSDLTRVVRNLAAATKPEGRLLLTVPRAESHTARQNMTIQPIPFVEITVHSWADAEVESTLDAAGLDVILHDVGPGFTAPDLGTVHYGFWELTRTFRHSAA